MRVDIPVRDVKVAGKNVVVTGKIDGETRGSVEARLLEAGAVVQRAVTRTTELLITGERAGASKTEAAERYGVAVVPWTLVRLSL